MDDVKDKSNVIECGGIQTRYVSDFIDSTWRILWLQFMIEKI